MISFPMVIQYRGHGLVALSLLIGYTAQCIWKSISGSIIRYSSFCSLLHLFIYSSSVANVWWLIDLFGAVKPLVINLFEICQYILFLIRRQHFQQLIEAITNQFRRFFKFGFNSAIDFTIVF